MTQPWRLRGMALCRIGLGIAGIDFYVSNFGQRELLFGPDGIVDAHTFSAMQQHAFLPSLYAASTSGWWFQSVYAVGLMVAILFTVIGGRPLTLLHGVFLWSLYDRNGFILDGGDNLASILVILLLLVVTDAYYSPMAPRRRRQVCGEAPGRWTRMAVPIHNAGVVAVTVQVATVYVCAGLWKVAGGLWQDGTAMYYVSRTLDFQFVPLGFLATNAITVTALSYFAVVANLGFPLGLVVPSLRPVTVANALLMHLGIIVVMGLTGFGLTMMAADLACLTDAEYEALHRGLGRLLRLATTRWQRSRHGRRVVGGGVDVDDQRHGPASIEAPWHIADGDGIPGMVAEPADGRVDSVIATTKR